jgi:hypothetical protein
MERQRLARAIRDLESLAPLLQQVVEARDRFSVSCYLVAEGL